jgi:hypothetical protein
MKELWTDAFMVLAEFSGRLLPADPAVRLDLLVALRGLRNGLVYVHIKGVAITFCYEQNFFLLSYGAKVRAPHALVTTLLYGRGPYGFFNSLASIIFLNHLLNF